MDMWKPYRDAVYAVLPNAYVVIDQFHVVRQANVALNEIRKAQRKKLNKKQNLQLKRERFVMLKRPKSLDFTHLVYRDAWFSELPTLKVAYDLKEMLFDMYKCKSREEAIAYYEGWKKSIPKEMKEFKAIAKTIDGLKKEVFNYFDGRVTNAISEGVNSVIRDIDGHGRGYDFEILRAKALFYLNHKIDKPKYASNTFGNMLYGGFGDDGCPKEHPEYLWSERIGNRLALNIVDAPKPEFFAKSMIDKSLDFIEKKLNDGLKVLVHCNEGMSRSPSICLLYLIKHGVIKGDTLEDCEAEFMKVYPEYNPGAGIRGFVKEYWREYVG